MDTNSAEFSALFLFPYFSGNLRSAYLKAKDLGLFECNIRIFTDEVSPKSLHFHLLCL